MQTNSLASPAGRIDPVDSGLFASALSLFLADLDHDSLAIVTQDKPDGSRERTIEAQDAVLHLAHRLRVDGEVAVALVARILATMRLLASDRSVAAAAFRGDEIGGGLTDEALAVAARLDLFNFSSDRMSDFNPGQFHKALSKPPVRPGLASTTSSDQG